MNGNQVEAEKIKLKETELNDKQLIALLQTNAEQGIAFAIGLIRHIFTKNVCRISFFNAVPPIFLFLHPFLTG